MSSLGSPSPFFLAGKKAYEVERSLRFNDGDSPNLARTPSGDSNKKKWTWSSWIKISASGTLQTLFSVRSGTRQSTIFLKANGQLQYFSEDSGGTTQANLKTNSLFRDPSAWYHVVVYLDAANTTGKIYVNGVEQSVDIATAVVNTDHNFNTTLEHLIGNEPTQSNYFDGYMAEVNFIDGQAYDPSYFGETDATTGQWNPKKYVGSYGTNGFYLNFSDNSGTTATTLGKDSSGNGNNFTPNNFSVSAGAGNDSVEDTPTNNFCTINPLAGRGTTFVDASNGNLDFNISAPSKNPNSTFQIPTSGKWYAEWVFTTVGSGVVNVGNLQKSEGSSAADQLNGISLLSGEIRVNDSSTQTSLTAFGNNDIIGVKVDRDAGTVAFTINGSAVGNAENISSMNAPTDLIFRAYRNSSGGSSPVGSVNFGQRPFSYLPTGYKSLCSANLPDPTILLPNKHFDTLLFSGTGNSGRTVTGLEFQPDWFWGKSRSAAFQHILYDSVRGTGTSKSLSSNQTNAEGHNSAHSNLTSFDAPTSGANGGVTFGATSSTDVLNYSGGNSVGWFWNAGDTDGKTYTVKVVSDGGNKYRFDDFGTSAVTLDLAEGGTYIFDGSDSSMASHPIKLSETSNGTHGGGSSYNTGVTYLLDGASVTESAYVSGYASATTRQLKIVVAASAPTLYYYCHYHSGMGGQANTNSTLGSSNFDGNLQSTVKVNATAGFSIVKWTSGANVYKTVGHGLGVKPDIVILKSRTTSHNWYVYTDVIDGTNEFLELNSTNAAADAESYSIVSPTSSVFGTDGAFLGGNTNIPMVAYVFSSVSSFSKIGSYVGNSSSDGTFVFTGFRPAWLMIKRTTGADNWMIHDNKRDPDNLVRNYLFADTSNAEAADDSCDFLSNGFKWRINSGLRNSSGQTYIYLAFAEAPFKNARAR